MKSRNVYIVAALAVILVVAVILIEKPFQEESEEMTPGSLNQINTVAVFENAGKENVRRIELSSIDGRTTTSLTKVDDKWYTNPERKYPAQTQKVENVLETISKIESGEVISKNPKNHSSFEVDKIQGKRVQLFDKNNKMLADVYVGKMGQGFANPSTYVRKVGDDEVLSVNGMLSHLVQPGERNWQDMTIFQLDPENIASFTIEKPREPTIEIVRTATDEWILKEPEGIRMKDDVGRRMVNSFSRLRGSDFVEDYPIKPFSEYDLGAGAMKITARLKDGSSTPTLFIGKESESKPNQWYIREKDGEMVYTIYKYTRDSLAWNVDNIQPTPTPPPATPTPSLQEKIQEEAEKKAEEIDSMTEEEKRKAVEKKFEEILKDHEERTLNNEPEMLKKEEETKPLDNME